MFHLLPCCWELPVDESWMERPESDCLNYFQLFDRPALGRASNMQEIVDLLMKANRSIYA